MPYICFPEDGVDMWYLTNCPVLHADAGGSELPQLDPSKETVLLLPGTIFDVSALHNQLNDPTLRSTYNLLAPDHRSAGKTRNCPSALRDGWVDAVGLIKFLDRAGAHGAVHVFAPCSISIHAALRMALLWPERVGSLALVSIMREEEEEWVAEAWRELVNMLTTAKSLETQEEAIHEMRAHTFYDGLPEDQMDEWALYIETQYPPARTARFFDFVFTVFLRENLTDEQMAQIYQPAVIITGDTFVCPRADAERLQAQLSFSSHGKGAALHLITDGPEQLYFPRPFAPTVNKYYTNFLASLPALPPPAKVKRTTMREALDRLAAITGDQTMKSKDEGKTESFSCLDEEKREERGRTLQYAEMSQKGAFDPTGPNGEPPRKFSERHHGSMFAKPVRRSWASGVKVSTDLNATEVLAVPDLPDLPAI